MLSNQLLFVVPISLKQLEIYSVNIPMRLLLVFLFSVFFWSLNAQVESKRLQYNIVVESKSDEDIIRTTFEIEDLDNSTNSKTVDSMSELISALFKDLSELPKNKNQVLFYVHGMWGGKKFAFDRTYKMIENLYIDHEDSDVARIISLKWPGNKMEYKVNKKKLYQIDDDVTELFEDFFTSYYTNRYFSGLPNIDIDMIAHSLGTELIKEVICQLPQEKFTSPIIDQLILASPDLATDVFEKEECFADNLHLANHTTVYFSTRDLTLGVSNNLNDLDRLGRAGPTENSIIPEQTTFVEISEIKDETNFSDLMTGHSSFRASPVVSRDILSILTKNRNVQYVSRAQKNKVQNIVELVIPNGK